MARLFFIGLVYMGLALRPTSAGAVDFEKEILPIFEAHCVACHGADKALAKLRLNSAEGIQAKLADDAHLLVAGDPEQSELYARLVLPADNKKRMPKGADPLDQQSIDLIAAWIKEGGSLAAVTPAEPAPTTAAAAEVAEPAAPQQAELEPLPPPEVPAASPEVVDQLIAAGAQVLPLYAGSHLVDVSFALAPQPPTDATLKLLSGIADQVYTLNLKNAKISETGWAVLAELKNLSAINVQGSSFTDSAADYLMGLERLETVNLYDTRVTDGVLEPLQAIPRLRKLYLWKTEVTYDGVLALEKEKPALEWNLGWNHPEIARKRLEQQQADFGELLKNSEAELARLKADLKVAEEALATNKTRLQEVEEELEKLAGDKPAEDSGSKESDSKESDAPEK